jgi:hypothetical protein
MKSPTRSLLVALALVVTAACGPALSHADGGEGEGEGEGDEGEGDGDEGEGEGEGEGDAGEGEGEGEGEGDPPPPPDTPLELRTDAEVCGTWNAFAFFQGDLWTPVGDGSDMCDIGTLADGAQQAGVDRVNLYRWLAGLPPIALEPSLIAQEQACAAMMAAIGHLDHFPQPDAPCYTDAAGAGAGSSNLAQGADPTYSVDLFVDDSSVGSLGHRRWVLNPSMSVTAFGFKQSFTCMYSFSQGGTANPTFVSWPPAGPVPVDAADGVFSFGTSAYGTTPDTKVEIDVDGAGFVEVPFQDLGWGYGSLATTLSFRPPNLQPWDVSQPGRTITVRISGLQSQSSMTETVTYTTRYVSCS